MALGTAVVAVVTDLGNNLAGVELLSSETKILVATVIGLWIIGEATVDAVGAYGRARGGG